MKKAELEEQNKKLFVALDKLLYLSSNEHIKELQENLKESYETCCCFALGEIEGEIEFTLMK